MHWRTAVEMHWRTAYSRPHSSNRRVGTPFPADTSQRWLLNLSSQRRILLNRSAAHTAGDIHDVIEVLIAHLGGSR